MDYPVLGAEIANDPLARGYAAMTDQQIAADLNTRYRTVERDSLSGSEIFNAIVPAEFAALAAADKTLVRDVFGLGDAVDVSTGTNARAVLLSAFGAATTTRSNLASAVNELVSRSTELGLSAVTAADVARVR